MAADTQNYDGYLEINGQRLALKKHPSAFSVLGHPQAAADHELRSRTLAANMERVEVDPSEIEDVMAEVREETVAHHIYQVEGTDEEIVITDRIILELRHQGTGLLDELIQEFHLIPEGRMGDAYILRVTDATGRNPLKVANEIALRDGVLSCMPEVMMDMQFHKVPALWQEQWYLSADSLSHPDLVLTVGVQAPEAWTLTRGKSETVIAVIDDGFDLSHPALRGVRIHPMRRDFVGGSSDPSSRGQDYHGTPVASIALGAHGESAMLGIAPNCTFLPIRIGFGPMVAPIDMLAVFRYVSLHADVVNCSFGTSPTSFDPIPSSFRRELTRIAETGGRRGKGLVMVFSAANDDAPTFLAGSQNKNGVKYSHIASGTIREISVGRTVYSGYPLTDGVVVVSAMSSLGRKSGYSCWGPHITVAAPSNNDHYIQRFIRAGSDPRREAFVANYRGLGQVAASNRPGAGRPFSPVGRVDNPATPDWQEDFYTRQFGGTSGAAPVVTGIVGLMLSVNPELTAVQVRQILMSTADRDLDLLLDLAEDPNLQGLTGEFVNGRSLFFGAGKVNAYRAVRRALALHQLFAVQESAAVDGVRDLAYAAPGALPAPIMPQMETCPPDVAGTRLVATAMAIAAHPNVGNGSNTYTVQPGDSLWLISSRIGIPWQELARINVISEPYTIFPGQVLKLSESPLPAGNGPGYHPPVGTLEERQSGKVWPGDWFDATGYAKVYWNGRTIHTGADLNLNTPVWDADNLAPVYAIADGVVTCARVLGSWGYVIVTRHNLPTPDGQRVYSRYAHLNRMDVQEQQPVARGQQIGLVGDGFGRFPAHLHFDISLSERLAGEPGDWPSAGGRDISDEAWARIQRDYVDPRLFLLQNHASRLAPVEAGPAALPTHVVPVG